MGKDIIVSINAENGSVYTSTPVLGISGENLEGQIIVEFFNGAFVDGEGTIEIERGGEKGFISMTKDAETKTYRLPIKSSLLSVVGKIKMQVKIEMGEKTEGVPTFKSAVFEITVEEAINATSTIPDEYPTWLDELNKKANVIPRPTEGTLVYATHSGRDSDQPYGIKIGTNTLEKYSIVVRDTNGQINLPDQIAYAPGDRQAICKEYADKHYAGGGAKQRLLHYAAHTKGWGDGAAFEHTVPLPIRTNDDGVYYNIADVAPKVFGADYAPDVVSLTIGDGSVAEASWSTNGIVVKRIDNQFGEAYDGTYKRWDSYENFTAETCHAFNTKAEFDAWKASVIPEGSWWSVTPQVGYWIEFI